MIPIHVSKSSLFKIHFYIFPLSTQRSSKQHNFFTCFHHKPLCISLLSHARNLPHPSYPPWYEHFNDVGRQKQIVTFHITEYSPTLFYFPPPNFKVFSHHTVFRHFRLYSRFSVRDKFRTHTKQKQYYSHIFQNCLYVFAKKTQGSGTNGCKYSSNLTSYLSITPKHVHFSHFLRIYKYFFYYFLIRSVDEVEQTLVSSFNSRPFFCLQTNVISTAFSYVYSHKMK